MMKYKTYKPRTKPVIQLKINHLDYRLPTRQADDSKQSLKEGIRRPFSRIGQQKNTLKIQKNKNFNKTERQQIQPDGNSQLQLIFRLSNQIFKTSKQSSRQNTQRNQDEILFEKLHILLNLYIKEQMLKHYCSKSEWRFEKKILDKLVLPTFDLLSVRKDKISQMFQPFLKQLTSRYILQTQLDTYSRLNPQQLLIQITQNWLRTKQAEIELKRIIRENREDFKQGYCKLQQGKYIFDRKRLYKRLFQNSNDIRMVNLIKIFIFCYKSTGENNQYSYQQWLQRY